MLETEREKIDEAVRACRRRTSRVVSVVIVNDTEYKVCAFGPLEMHDFGGSVPELIAHLGKLKYRPATSRLLRKNECS